LQKIYSQRWIFCSFELSPKHKNFQIIVILSLLQKATQRVARRSHSKKIHTTAVILSVAKNPQNLKHALNLWILRFLMKAQYDNDSVILSGVR